MAFWRMQLHPTDPARAAMYAVQSLAAGFIGLGIRRDPGDLTLLPPSPLPEGVTAHDLGFATKMAEGDSVLVILHHFPFALATVQGGYKYVRETVPELRIWFNHFRRVRDVRYNADRVTNAREWEEIKMTSTVQILTDPDSASYRLISAWNASAAAKLGP
jgi:hypothetical protein